MIEEHHCAAHALDADVKSDARAQRGFLENQGDEFAVQRGGVANRSRLDVRREVEEFAGVRGAPFRSGEEIG